MKKQWHECEDCGKKVRNTPQAIGSHRGRVHSDLSAKKINNNTGLWDAPAGPRSGPRSDEKIGPDLLRENDSVSAGLDDNIDGPRSPSSSLNKEEKEKPLPFPLQVEDPARRVKDAIAFIDARLGYLNDWQRSFFVSVRARVTDGLIPLTRKQQGQLFEIEAVVRDLASQQEADDKYMERAWHPLQRTKPEHNPAACWLCQEEVEAEKRAEVAFNRDYAEMMAGLAHWHQHKNQPDCPQCETYREWKRVNG